MTKRVIRLIDFDVVEPSNLAGQGYLDPKAELFIEDGLHLNTEGYKVWTEQLQPVIKQALKHKPKT